MVRAMEDDRNRGTGKDETGGGAVTPLPDRVLLAALAATLLADCAWLALKLLGK